jgi:hypothetical protein
MEAASLDTVAKPTSPKMMLASSKTSIRYVDNEETWENMHEGRQGRNRSQRDIATNFEMLPSELEVTRGRFMTIGARNRYLEEILCQVKISHRKDAGRVGGLVQVRGGSLVKVKRY